MVVTTENGGMLFKMNSSSLSSAGKNCRKNKLGVKNKFQLHLPIKEKVIPLWRCQQPTGQPPYWHAKELLIWFFMTLSLKSQHCSIITTLLEFGLLSFILNGRNFEGLLPTYLCLNHSFYSLKLATFSSPLPDVFTVVMLYGLKHSIWSQIGGCYLVWAQQESSWETRRQKASIYTYLGRNDGEWENWDKEHAK